MDDRQELLASLMAVRRGWDEFLQARSEEQLTAPRLPGGWSVREVITHLAAWQQISIARVEAAQRGSQPELPAWLGGVDPFFAEEHTEQFNARIVELYAGQGWPGILSEWREGFARFLELAQVIPEQTLFDAQRFAWLKGYPLAAVVSGSREHHEEHLEECAAAFA